MCSPNLHIPVPWLKTLSAHLRKDQGHQGPAGPPSLKLGFHSTSMALQSPAETPGSSTPTAGNPISASSYPVAPLPMLSFGLTCSSPTTPTSVSMSWRGAGRAFPAFSGCFPAQPGNAAGKAQCGRCWSGGEGKHGSQPNGQRGNVCKCIQKEIQ